MQFTDEIEDGLLLGVKLGIDDKGSDVGLEDGCR
jgi:hypothetical protein